MSNIAGLHSTSFPAVPATTGTSLTEAHTKQLHESYLRALQQTCEEEGRALKKLTTPSLVTDGQQRVGSLAVNASPSVRQISIHDQSKQSHATEIPDLLSGFENIAKNSVSSSSTDCALALRAHGQSFAMNPASDLDHERKTSVMTSTLPGSPPFTSRSFDDFHRFLGKDLTLDSDVTGSEINTSISSVSHVVLDTSALFAAESYAMFARESALEANRLVSDFVPLSDAPLSTKVGSQTQITCEVDSMLKQVCEHTFGSPAIVISKRPLIDDSKLHVHHHAKSVVSVDISGKELVQQSMLQASQVTSSVPKAAFIVERFMGASNLVSGSEPSGSSSSNSNGNHEESSSMDTAGTADCSEDEDSNISDSSSGSDVAPHRNKKSKLDESNGGTPISARRVQFEKRL